MPVVLNGRGGIVVEHSGGDDADDDMWEDAVRVVVENKKPAPAYCSAVYALATAAPAALWTLWKKRALWPADGQRPRDVLVSSMNDVFGW